MDPKSRNKAVIVLLVAPVNLAYDAILEILPRIEGWVLQGALCPQGLSCEGGARCAGRPNPQEGMGCWSALQATEQSSASRPAQAAKMCEGPGGGQVSLGHLSRKAKSDRF